MDEAVDNLSELDECNNIEDAEYVLELKEAVLTLELRYCELDVYEVEGTSLELLEVDEVDEVEGTSLELLEVDEDETGSVPCKTFPRTGFLVDVYEVEEASLELLEVDEVDEVEGTSLELLEVDEVDEVEETSLKVPGVDEDETGSGPCKSFPRTPFLVVVVDVVGVVEVVDVVELELELASADTGQQYCGKSAFEWF